MSVISNARFQHNILYLDKIVAPSDLSNIQDKVMKLKPKNCEVKFVALIP